MTVCAAGEVSCCVVMWLSWNPWQCLCWACLGAHWALTRLYLAHEATGAGAGGGLHTACMSMWLGSRLLHEGSIPASPDTHPMQLAQPGVRQ